MVAFCNQLSQDQPVAPYFSVGVSHKLKMQELGFEEFV
jgi:hypothetical protein